MDEDVKLADQMASEQSNAKRKMLQGSAWMTAGSIFSRVLGAIYIIPWNMWLGPDRLQANALYSMGYNVYSFFLMIAVAGVPSAVAKQVAHYNAQNEYGIGRRLFKYGMALMAIMGVVCAVILWIIAPYITSGDKNVIPVFRSLSWALLIIPMMSLIRGFFQGYQEMAPSAISQFFEQIARVIYMLGATFIIMKVSHGSYITGVTQSTFAAFIGALGGMLVLVWYFYRRKPELDRLVANSDNKLTISTQQIIKEVIRESIPFIIIGAAITIFGLIDQYTFFGIMTHVTNYTRTVQNELWALFSFNANKLVMIIISIASAMSITAIPLLSEAYTRNDKKALSEQTSDTLQLFFFVMLPCALGMAAVAHPLYVIFYGYDPVGIYVLQFSAYESIFLGLFTVVSAILQGVYQNKKAIVYFFVGMIIKLVVQYPLVAWLGAFGPLAATAIGMGVSSWLMIRSLHKMFHLNVRLIQARLNKMMIYALMTFFIALLAVKVIYLFLPMDSRISAIITIIIAAGLGGYVYIYFSLKTRLADKILGDRVAGLRRRLRIK
ncbi:putative polysaccharide biosynthesis protein [Dellaglioa carnosa]|uniref:Polysaccharide biosynthesis protein n=1 Tax=Dellaglioa carnosa TaxID=2995136 RepID=A0ABT4JQ28_9LACO|nr:polysaccharide biosynthesis protein [Dellaglioa carnosa]MCZ2491902.1 polysaccharide biosynthesis protein [Dellaglioa carnosa]MCZ2495053.1 polysaccharide biosynthesis protein [Dellaglioa carnosa]MDK1731916.1 polysaccharide biosynthesis protein [Dellaglioa carnosa]